VDPTPPAEVAREPPPPIFVDLTECRRAAAEGADAELPGPGLQMRPATFEPAIEMRAESGTRQEPQGVGREPVEIVSRPDPAGAGQRRPGPYPPSIPRLGEALRGVRRHDRHGRQEPEGDLQQRLDLFW